jgi:hypothetical protein
VLNVGTSIPVDDLPEQLTRLALDDGIDGFILGGPPTGTLWVTWRTRCFHACAIVSTAPDGRPTRWGVLLTSESRTRRSCHTFKNVLGPIGLGRPADAAMTTGPDVPTNRLRPAGFDDRHHPLTRAEFQVRDELSVKLDVTIPLDGP